MNCSASHTPEPAGTPVRMHLDKCEHGEAYVCISDLMLWLDRLAFNNPEHGVCRDYVVEELASMAVTYDIGTIEEWE